MTSGRHTELPEPPELARLTDREREILLFLGRGYANAEIAAELFLGEATVKTHVSNCLTKLGLRDRVHAVIYAYEAGLITPADS
jgi:DNA-binding NarL/FixJ family response regulator